MLPIRVRLQFSSWAHLVGSKMRPLKPKSGGRSAGWMFAFTHKFTCFLIHSPKRKQTYLSASPLSAFYSALNAFSHSLKKKKLYSKVGFCFLLTRILTGFLHVYPLGMALSSWEVFYRLYKRTALPSRDFQTDTNHFDMSFFSPFFPYRM